MLLATCALVLSVGVPGKAFANWQEFVHPEGETEYAKRRPVKWGILEREFRLEPMNPVLEVPVAGGFLEVRGLDSRGGILAYTERGSGSWTAQALAWQEGHENTDLPPQANAVDQRMDFRDLSPHIGIRWGSHVGEGGRWFVSLDMGLGIKGQSFTNASMQSPLEFDPGTLGETDDDKEAWLDELREAPPFMGLGLTYRF